LKLLTEANRLGVSPATVISPDRIGDHLAEENHSLSEHAVARTPRVTAKLNVFQRLVRQWDSIHPYNGAQVVKIRGRVDLELCRRAWLEALEALGLGVVSIAQKSYTYRCLNGEAIYHGVVRCPDGTKLEEWLSNELNRPFNDDGGVPFRPFVLQEESHFWMGLCYQHWVADSASIRMLMREWFVRQFDAAAVRPRELCFHAGGYFSLFGPHRDGAPPTKVFLSTLRWHPRFQKVRRIEDREKFADMRLAFQTIQAPERLIDALRATARRTGATVNDLFLAAIAQVCDEFVPVKRRYRRQQLAVGSIVDLRNGSRQPLRNLFDLLLGFTSVWCTDDVLPDWRKLVETIAGQTREQKRCGLPLASGLRMAYGIIAGKCLSRDGIIEFYRKRVPLAGANSNVNLNHCWAAKYAGDPVLDYVRVAPTGPITPLVFSTTTLGQGMSIGLTYRRAIITAEMANLIGEKFIARLRDLVHPD
jgi:hypothetical protein